MENIINYDVESQLYDSLSPSLKLIIADIGAAVDYAVARHYTELTYSFSNVTATDVKQICDYLDVYPFSYIVSPTKTQILYDSETKSYLTYYDCNLIIDWSEKRI